MYSCTNVFVACVQACASSVNGHVQAAVAGVQDCRAELHGLLKEEKLAGASLLILANKQDMPGALSAQQIEQARVQHAIPIGKPQSILAKCSLPCAPLKLH